MSTLELPWAELNLGGTLFEEDSSAPLGSYVLQWHTAGCTLYVVCGERDEIDLRLDSEVFEIKYEDVDGDTDTRVISLRMHPCRPVVWAEDTEFVPGYTKNGKIIIKIDVSGEDDIEIYQLLTAWMQYTTYPGATTSMTKKESDILWQSLCKNFCTIDENAPDPVDNNPIIFKSEWGQLAQRDTKRLERGQWANDEIVNFGMNLMTVRLESDDAEDIDIHLFSSYVFTKLNEGGMLAQLGDTKNINIFTKDMVFYPVHRDDHWSLVVLDGPAKALVSINEDASVDNQVCTDPALLYVLDSIRGRPFQPIVDVILKHLRFEAFAWEDKKIDEARIISRKPPVPVQRNGCDCGYYMIHFFDLILSNPTQYRKILKEGNDSAAYGNWKGDSASDMRKKIKSFVISAAEYWI